VYEIIFVPAKITDNEYIVTFTKHHVTVNPPNDSHAPIATKCNDLYNMYNLYNICIICIIKRNDFNSYEWKAQYGFEQISSEIWILEC